MTMREFWESLSDEERKEIDRKISASYDTWREIKLNDAADMWALLSPEQQKARKCPE